MKLFSTIFFSLLIVSAFSQMLIPYRKGDKWGYCDEDKKIIIKCKFDSVSLFRSYGPALVIKENKTGFINRKGKVVIPCQYDQASEFYHNPNPDDSSKIISWVINNKTQFCIDTLGRKAVVRQPKQHCIDCITGFGNVIFKNKKSGFVFIDPKDTIPPIYDEIQPSSDFIFIKNLLRAKLNGKWGIISRHNEVRVPFDYNDLQPISYGYSGEPVYFKAYSETGTVGVVNEFGKLLVPMEYEWVRREDGKVNGVSRVYFTVRKDSLLGVFDDSGKIMIPLKYKGIRVYDNNLVAAQAANGYYGLLGDSGKILLPFKYAFTYAAENGLITTYAPTDNKGSITDGKKGLFTSNSKEILPPVYDQLELKPPPSLSRSKICITAMRDSMWSVWDDTGKLLTPVNYPAKDFLPMFIRKDEKFLLRVYFCVREDGLWGLIDDSGKRVLPCKYLKIELFDKTNIHTPGETIAKVQTANGKWGYVGLDGVEYFEE